KRSKTIAPGTDVAVSCESAVEVKHTIWKDQRNECVFLAPKFPSKFKRVPREDFRRTCRQGIVCISIVLGDIHDHNLKWCVPCDVGDRVLVECELRAESRPVWSKSGHVGAEIKRNYVVVHMQI